MPSDELRWSDKDAWNTYSNAGKGATGASEKGLLMKLFKCNENMTAVAIRRQARDQRLEQ